MNIYLVKIITIGILVIVGMVSFIYASIKEKTRWKGKMPVKTKILFVLAFVCMMAAYAIMES